MAYRHGRVRRESDEDRAEVAEVAAQRRKRMRVVWAISLGVAGVLAAGLVIVVRALDAPRDVDAVPKPVSSFSSDLPALDAFGGPAEPWEPPWQVALCDGGGSFEYRELGHLEGSDKPWGIEVRRTGDLRHVLKKRTHERWFYEDHDVCDVGQKL
jgi:hypothetical protein